MKQPKSLEEALDRADALRKQAEELGREADALETQWTGVRQGTILTVRKLVETIERIAGTQ